MKKNNFLGNNEQNFQNFIEEETEESKLFWENLNKNFNKNENEEKYVELQLFYLTGLEYYDLSLTDNSYLRSAIDNFKHIVESTENDWSKEDAKGLQNKKLEISIYLIKLISKFYASDIDLNQQKSDSHLLFRCLNMIIENFDALQHINLIPILETFSEESISLFNDNEQMSEFDLIKTKFLESFPEKKNIKILKNNLDIKKIENLLKENLFNSFNSFNIFKKNDNKKTKEIIEDKKEEEIKKEEFMLFGKNNIFIDIEAKIFVSEKVLELAYSKEDQHLCYLKNLINKVYGEKVTVSSFKNKDLGFELTGELDDLKKISFELSLHNPNIKLNLEEIYFSSKKFSLPIPEKSLKHMIKLSLILTGASAGNIVDRILLYKTNIENSLLKKFQEVKFTTIKGEEESVCLTFKSPDLAKKFVKDVLLKFVPKSQWTIEGNTIRNMDEKALYILYQACRFKNVMKLVEKTGNEVFIKKFRAIVLDENNFSASLDKIFNELSENCNPNEKLLKLCEKLKGEGLALQLPPGVKAKEEKKINNFNFNN